MEVIGLDLADFQPELAWLGVVEDKKTKPDEHYKRAITATMYVSEKEGSKLL